MTDLLDLVYFKTRSLHPGFCWPPPPRPLPSAAEVAFPHWRSLEVATSRHRSYGQRTPGNKEGALLLNPMKATLFLVLQAV